MTESMREVLGLKEKTYEEFVASRRAYIGASDAASVLGAGRYGCKRKLAYDKLGFEKDIDDSARPEFTRGRRLEQAAADYYQEKTGRKLKKTETAFVAGKPHLGANLDRLVWAPERGPAPGYLEIKVVGRGSMIQIKKNGLIEDYAIQLQAGCAVKEMKWGSFAIYSPETDELLHWDVEADKALGEKILEEADDFFSFHVERKVIPNALPDGSKPCETCPWAITCREGREIPAAASGIIILPPEMEGLVAKFAEIKGISSEASDAGEGLREEILAAIGEKPGLYQAGKYQFKLTIAEQKRFSGAALKLANPEMYEKFRESTVVKTLTKPREV